MWTERYPSSQATGEAANQPRNVLLRSLPREDLERLLPSLHRVALTPRRVLQHAGVPIEHLYFVEEGLVSVLAKTDQHEAVEIWLIGREGAVGSAVALGSRTSALSYFVQIGGSALRIGVEDLNRAMAGIPSLRASLHGYLHTSLMQSSQSAACGLRHSFAQRLARWLLTAQDRSDRDELPITQDLLARSLGVRRPTVSETFRLLEHRGIFGRERGLIKILDRNRLEKIACQCYRAMCLRHEKREAGGKSRRLFVMLSALCVLLELEVFAQ